MPKKNIQVKLYHDGNLVEKFSVSILRTFIRGSLIAIFMKFKLTLVQKSREI